MEEILSELIDEYIDRHQETMELLSRPDWIKIVNQGKSEIMKGIKGKNLDKVED